MLDLAVVENSYKVGRHYIFDKSTAKGYKVIRKNGEVIDFVEVYKLVKNERNENDYDVKANTDVPLGIIRKSIEILEKAWVWVLKVY